MRNTSIYILLSIVLAATLCSCDYDEEVEVLDVDVQLVYPANSIEPYEGARVELANAAKSVFVDSTDASGMAHFSVPPGVYSLTSANTLLTYDYRYICNGTRSDIVISPDSINSIELNLKVTKKRIVH